MSVPLLSISSPYHHSPLSCSECHIVCSYWNRYINYQYRHNSTGVADYCSTYLPTYVSTNQSTCHYSVNDPNFHVYYSQNLTSNIKVSFFCRHMDDDVKAVAGGVAGGLAGGAAGIEVGG
jgi:hypothetical protein